MARVGVLPNRYEEVAFDDDVGAFRNQQLQLEQELLGLEIDLLDLELDIATTRSQEIGIFTVAEVVEDSYEVSDVSSNTDAINETAEIALTPLPPKPTKPKKLVEPTKSKKQPRRKPQSPRIRTRIHRMENAKVDKAFFEDLPDGDRAKLRALERRWRLRGQGIHKDDDKDLTYLSASDSIGQYFNEIASNPLLTPEGEKFLFSVLGATEDPIVRNWIREKIYACNLKLVVYKAKTYPKGSDEEFMAYIAEGNLSLSHAIRLFDVERGFKFSTYAMFWIRQGIGRYIDTTKYDMSLPIDVSNALSSVRRTAKKDGVDITLDYCLRLYPDDETLAMKIFEAHLMVDAVALNKTYGEDGSVELVDLIGIDGLISSDVIEFSHVIQSVEQELEGLLTREEFDILKRRLGNWGMAEKESFASIGVSFGFTGEYIRRKYVTEILPKAKRVFAAHFNLTRV